VWFNRPDEYNTMSSGRPEGADNARRETWHRRAGTILGLFMLLFGVPPLLNAIGNPRVQALHGPDVLGLVASGLCFGLGLGLLLTKLVLRGE